MAPTDAVASCYANYANFSGRAVRSEFWWMLAFILAAELVFFAVFYPLSGLMRMQHDMAFTLPLSAEIVAGIFAFWVLATLVPYLALIVRRLHDLDRSGWHLLVYLVPLVGPIIVIVWMCTKATAGPNRFGPERLV